MKPSPCVCFNVVLLEELQQLDLVQSKELIFFSFSLVTWHHDPTEGQSSRRWMDGKWKASVWASVCSFVLICQCYKYSSHLSLCSFLFLSVSLPFFWTIFMEVWQPSRDHFIAIECHAKCVKLCEREGRWQTFPAASVQWRRRAPVLLLKKEVSDEGNLHSSPRGFGMTRQSKLWRHSRRNTGVIHNNDSLFQCTRLLWREVGTQKIR